MEASHHMHMSYDMTNQNMHDVRTMGHDMADHGDCCETSDICTHEHCTMSGSQAFGVLKSAQTGIMHSLKMTWSHDIVAQRDGHRPLLDPPIP